MLLLLVAVAAVAVVVVDSGSFCCGASTDINTIGTVLVLILIL